MPPSSSRALLAALLLSGCGPRAGVETTPAAGSAPSPRALPATGRAELGRLPPPPPGTGEGLHTDFARAFQDGLVIERPEERLEITVHQGGRLEVGAGSVLVGDPGYAPSLKTLPLTIPRGSYAVQVSQVRARSRRGEAGERVAAMRLLLGPAPARRWLYVDTIAVDSGSAALLTPSAAEVLAQEQARAQDLYRRRLQGEDVQPPPDSVDARLQAAFQADMMAAVLLQSHLPRGPVNIAACSSGFGDGSYDVYVGLDESGVPVELVIDFRVLLDPVMAEVLIPDMDAVPVGPIPLGPLAEHGLRAWRGGRYDPWLLLDASALWNNPLYGAVQIEVESPEGRPLHADSTMQGGIHRLAAPQSPRPRLRIRVQVGVRPL